jgi:FAD/FMN-containing dehydrogenase
VSTLDIATLRQSFNGAVIAAGDESYDRARQMFYGGMDRRPAVILRPADADEVSRVVRLAAETGLDLAIRSGGHSVAGHSVCDDGIVLDLSRLKALDIDAERRVAHAQTGLTAAEYTSAAAEYGLGTGFGDTGSVGIGGITLGGGVGYLSRKYGLTIDSLLAADVVTADGTLLHTDEEHHPDLFWAIRGGGGNFGVATRFTYRLHDVSSVVGGMLVLPATEETVEAFMAIALAAPAELSTIASVMPAPPMPFLPPDVHGQLILLAMLCYAGDPAGADRVFGPFRVLATPIADMIRPMPYPQIYPPDPEDFHPVAASHTMFLDTFGPAVAKTILDRISTSDAQMRAIQLRALGGADSAVARVPNDATAYAHRDRWIMANVAALGTDAEQVAAQQPWVDDFAAALRQRTDTRAYVGFLGDEGSERVRDAYPGATWDRLAAVKATYDPTNLFHGNQNIPPTANRG